MSNAVAGVGPASGSSEVSFGAVDHALTTGVNTFILWAIALSGLLFILEKVGFLPSRLIDFLNRNRLRETLHLLKGFGIDVETAKRVNLVVSLESISAFRSKERVVARLDKAKIGHTVISALTSVPSNEYLFDGVTTASGGAAVFDRDWRHLWRSLTEPGGSVSHIDIDLLVTPKAGRRYWDRPLQYFYINLFSPIILSQVPVKP